MIDKRILKRLKLILFDLDGTLLDNEANIGEETVQLVEKLKKFDVQFSFATGRLQSAINKYAEELQINTPLISLDGSLIKAFNSREIVFKSYVPARYVSKAIKLADNYLLKIALCHDEAIYYTEYNSLVPQILDKLGAEYSQIDSYDNYLNKTLEVVVAGDISENVRFIRERMTFPYAFGLNTTFYKSHGHGGIYYLEIRKKGVDKGTGTLRLAKYLGIKINECAIMGDWYNDRGMFQTKALKIAVANAVPEIKRMANYITKRSNDEDAAAEFLEMVLRAKEG